VSIQCAVFHAEQVCWQQQQLMLSHLVAGADAQLVLGVQQKQHSYRDLPKRWAELGTVYRYERSGTMHGLFRVRGFTQASKEFSSFSVTIHPELLAVITVVAFAGLEPLRCSTRGRDSAQTRHLPNFARFVLCSCSLPMWSGF